MRWTDVDFAFVTWSALFSPTCYSHLQHFPSRRWLAAMLMPNSLARRTTGLWSMEEDFDLYGNRYEWLTTIFYISYLVCMSGVLLWKRFPANMVCAVTMVCWYASP